MFNTNVVVDITIGNGQVAVGIGVPKDKSIGLPGVVLLPVESGLGGQPGRTVPWEDVDKEQKVILRFANKKATAQFIELVQEVCGMLKS